jgi:hypothetical protein
MTPWIAPDAPRRPPLHSPGFKVRRALARLKPAAERASESKQERLL